MTRGGGAVSRTAIKHPRSWQCSERHCDCCGYDARDPEAGMRILCSGCGRYLCEACARGCRHERREHFHVAPSSGAPASEPQARRP